MTEPEIRYEREAARAIDRLRAEASDSLWTDICDAVDTIIDHPDSRNARAEELRGRDGKAIWKVDVFDRDDDWALLWHYEDNGLVVIAWVGLWLPG